MRTGKKASGGKYVQSRKKKLFEMPGQKRTVTLGAEKGKSKRIRGNKTMKFFLLKAKFVNVSAEKEGKSRRVEIRNVLETPSNRFLARQNIITKGSIVQTDMGKVRITNRPSQEKMANGMLVEGSAE
jgi:small subunit ribosomal protein S8e